MTDDLTSELRQGGLKVTESRLKVLQAVKNLKHSSADDIFKTVVATMPGTSVQTVYGVLASLTSAAIIRRIEPAGSAALYEAEKLDNHHHVVCRNCSKVEDIPCVIGQAPCLHPSDTKGFHIDEAEIVFWGICPDCAD